MRQLQVVFGYDTHGVFHSNHAGTLTALTIYRNKAIMADAHAAECAARLATAALAQPGITGRRKSHSDTVALLCRDLAAIKAKVESGHSDH